MKHFLYLTDTRLVSLVARGGRIVSRREFAVSGAGAAEFERYLGTFAEVPTHIFTDLAEEDFRLDTIPHVGARDRDAIVARKLGQIYRNTPFRHGLLQGREAEGRRDDRVLYTAITNPELLRPWLDAIERLKVPVFGIHSAAVFSAVLLDELDLFFPHALLVTFTPGEEMRQTYFRDREIKFSRLTPIDLEEGQTLGAMVAEETTRTWQYLDSLRHFGEGDSLEVCILAHARDRDALAPSVKDFAQIKYRILDIEQVAAKLGLKPPPLDSTAEEVMVHLFLLKKAENHFASPELRRHATTRKTRIFLNQVSIAILGVAILWAGWNLSGVFRASEADQRLSQDLRQINREYDEIAKSLPTLGVGGSAMRDAVAFYSGSIRDFPVLTDFLVPISGVLREHPQVRLSQVTWQATDDPKAAPRIAAIPPKNAPPVKSIAKGEGGAVQLAAEDNPNPQFAGGRFEVALIEGTVRAANNDFRGAMAEVEKLAADIDRIDGFRASVAEGPLDTSPGVALQGRHGEREPSTMDPRFVLKIVRERRGAG